jgi:hypothetical protein
MAHPILQRDAVTLPMLKTQRQIVEGQMTVQDAIDRELKAVDDAFREREWSDCPERERQLWNVRARISVLDRVLERAEVKRSKRLFRHLSDQRQMYQSALLALLTQPEDKRVASSLYIGTEYIPKFERVSQQQIDAVLNAPQEPFLTRLWTTVKGWRPFSVYEEYYVDDETFLLDMEEEIQRVEGRLKGNRGWEQLTEDQRTMRILEEKITLCERVITVAVLKQRKELLCYALRAKECYAIYLDAVRLEAPPP